MGNKAPTSSASASARDQQPQWPWVPHSKPMDIRIINLDADPKDRWKEIGKEYKTQLKQIIEEMKKTIPESVLPLFDKFGSELDSLLPQPYSGELRGLAEVTEIPVGELFVFNLVYDITAHCTSIVAQRSKYAQPLHARNLDMPPEVKDITSISRHATFTVQFQRAGETVYSGVTTVGIIGLLTGQKPNSFTITVNERRTGSIWTNIFHILRDHPGSAITFQVRDALADPDLNYQGVLKRMIDIPMIAACYVIIAGTKPGEGAVITRDREEAVKPFDKGVWKLNDSDGTWYLLQTNTDHWTKPPNLEPSGHDEQAMFSYRRQVVGNKQMGQMGPSNLSPQNLINPVLSTVPVLNEHTLYSTVMSAADPSLEKSWIRDYPPPPESAQERA